MRCALRLALGLAMIGAASCGGGGDSETADGPTTTVRVELTTTTNPPTTTTTTAPLSEEDQIRRTAAELIRAVDALYMAPDPSRVGEIDDPQCSCFESLRTDLADLQSRGLRFKNAPTAVLGVRLQDNSFEGLPVLTVVVRADEAVIVDGQGNEVERRPGTQQQAIGFSYDLIGRGGDYLIAAISALQLEPDVVQAIIAEGVP